MTFGVKLTHFSFQSFVLTLRAGRKEGSVSVGSSQFVSKHQSNISFISNMETNSTGLRVSFPQNLHLLNSCKVLHWALPFNFIRWFTIGRKGYVQQVGGQCRSWIILTKPHNNAFYLSTRHTSARQCLRSGYTRVISLLATRKLSITFPIFKGIENVLLKLVGPVLSIDTNVVWTKFFPN